MKKSFSSKKLLLTICTIAFTFLLCAGVLCYLYFTRYYTVTYTAVRFEESSAALNNPYQGFYRLYGYRLGNPSFPSQEDWEESLRLAASSDSNSLALLEINLRDYSSGAIPEEGLKQLDTILSCWSGENHRLILRFLYDWDGCAPQTEPESLDTVLLHMEQTASVVNRYAGSVYIMQGIFIGNYGEMHGSLFTGTETASTLLNQLAQVTDSSIYLAVRTPAQWRTLTGSLTPLSHEQLSVNPTAARLSLFNDGMLGSDTDLGSYGTTSREGSADPSAKGTRSEELAFQDELCRYVPNGGEVVIDNSFNDFPQAVSDLRRMHVSYLNQDYDPAVLEKWKSQTYTGSDCFTGCTVCEYIERHLGYRYVLRSSGVSFHPLKNKNAQMTVIIENTGFSNSYVSFPVILTAENILTGENYLLSADDTFLSSRPDVHTETGAVFTKELFSSFERPSLEINTKAWDSGKETTLTFPIPVRDMGAGTYRLYLTVTDPSDGRLILFGNTASPEPSKGYLLGELTVCLP